MRARPGFPDGLPVFTAGLSQGGLVALAVGDRLSRRADVRFGGALALSPAVGFDIPAAVARTLRVLGEAFPFAIMPGPGEAFMSMAAPGWTRRADPAAAAFFGARCTLNVPLGTMVRYAWVATLCCACSRVGARLHKSPLTSSTFLSRSRSLGAAPHLLCHSLALSLSWRRRPASCRTPQRSRTSWQSATARAGCRRCSRTATPTRS